MRKYLQLLLLKFKKPAKKSILGGGGGKAEDCVFRTEEWNKTVPPRDPVHDSHFDENAIQKQPHLMTKIMNLHMFFEGL